MALICVYAYVILPFQIAMPFSGWAVLGISMDWGVSSLPVSVGKDVHYKYGNYDKSVFLAAIHP